MSAFPLPPRVGLELHQELHARPALPARSPCVVSYWVQVGMTGACAEQALHALCLSVGAAEPKAGLRHARVQGPGWQLKFERHGEFVSWQVNRPLAPWAWPDGDNLARQKILAASALVELPPAFRDALAAEGADGAALMGRVHR
jgi:uncharacterized membrane-anchored protein